MISRLRSPISLFLSKRFHPLAFRSNHHSFRLWSVIRIDSDWEPIKHCCDRRKIRGQTVRVAGVSPGSTWIGKHSGCFVSKTSSTKFQERVHEMRERERERINEEESHFLWRFVIGQEADYRGNKGTPFFERDDLSLPVCVERKRHAVAKSLQNKQNGRDWKWNGNEVILCSSFFFFFFNEVSDSRRFFKTRLSKRKINFWEVRRWILKYLFFVTDHF